MIAADVSTSEEWRDVTRCPDYEVSSLGRVRNPSTGLVRKLWKHKSGHLYVYLDKKHAVHTLVMEAFVGSRPPNLECRHLNGVPHDNRVSNLVWGTRQNNIDDYARHNGRHIKAAFTPDEIAQIRRGYSGRKGEQRKLARRFSVSPSVICNLLKGRTYAGGAA